LKKVLLFLLVMPLVGGVFGPMPKKSLANPLDAFRSALPEETGVWKKDSEDRLFDPVTIFDHIDGAGEVYRAYNMQGCLSRRYRSTGGSSIVVDIFDMGSPEDAFGVFTHDQDGVPWKLGQEALYRAGWLRFWKDRFFVSIYGEEETARAKEAMAGLAERVASHIVKEGDRPSLILRLPREGLDTGSIRYFHEHVIFNAHYYLSDENILLLGPDTDAVIAGYQRDTGSAILLLVEYADPARAREALEGFRRAYLPEAKAEEAVRIEDGKWAAAALQERQVIIVLEADSRELAQDLLTEHEKNR